MSAMKRVEDDEGKVVMEAYLREIYIEMRQTNASSSLLRLMQKKVVSMTFEEFCTPWVQIAMKCATFVTTRFPRTHSRYAVVVVLKSIVPSSVLKKISKITKTCANICRRLRLVIKKITRRQDGMLASEETWNEPGRSGRNAQK
jgi:uncharacterized protein with von Willebrand factor type A (vWA) domain